MKNKRDDIISFQQVDFNKMICHWVFERIRIVLLQNALSQLEHVLHPKLSYWSITNFL